MAYQSPKPFLLLLTIPRTGSNWLAQVLEVNGLAAPLEFMKTWREASAVDEFEKVMLRNEAILGMTQSACEMLSTKMFPDEYELIGTGPHRWSQFIQAPELHTLVLWRRDLRAQAYSYYVAKQSGRWYNHGEVQALAMDKQKLLEAFEFVLNDLDRLASMVKDIGRHKSLVYEDLISDMPKAIREIYQFVSRPVPKEIKLDTHIQANIYQEDRERIWDEILNERLLEREQKAHALCRSFSV